MSNLGSDLHLLIKQNLSFLKSVIIIIIVIFVTINCRSIGDRIFNVSRYGPMSLEEAKKVVEVSIHTLGYSYNKTKKIEAVYYYNDNGSELILHTYFTTQNSTGEVVRVAKLSTFNLWSGPSINEVTDSKVVNINWASDTGRTCKVLESSVHNEDFSGEPYQSCLYWYDMNRQPYKLLTIWSEDEAVDFANLLSKVENDN